MLKIIFNENKFDYPTITSFGLYADTSNPHFYSWPRWVFNKDGKPVPLKLTEHAVKQIVPHGDYCYNRDGVCPFWAKHPDKPKQENGYCSLLMIGDWEEKTHSLLWDQCKECGINDSDDYGYSEWKRDILRILSNEIFCKEVGHTTHTEIIPDIDDECLYMDLIPLLHDMGYFTYVERNTDKPNKLVISIHPL